MQVLTDDTPVCLDLLAEDGELDEAAQPGDDGEPLPKHTTHKGTATPDFKLLELYTNLPLAGPNFDWLYISIC